MNWNNDHIAYINKLRSSGFTWQHIASMLSTDFDLSVTEDACRKAYARYTTCMQAYTLPENTLRRFTKPLELTTQSWLAMGDIHADLYDRQFMQRAMLAIDEMSIDTIIIGGDLFNADVLMVHPQNERISPLEKEFQIVGELLFALGNMKSVRQLVITMGNHDERIFKKLNTFLSFEMVVNAALNGKKPHADLFVSDFDYCFVNSLFSSWVIGHLDKYSPEAGKLAYQIAKKHNRNAAVFHDHLQGVVADSSRMGVSVGCMMQTDASFYKERRLNTMQQFTQGFLVVKNDKPFLFNRYGLSPINGSIAWEDLF